jgi:hypothetical protein
MMLVLLSFSTEFSTQKEPRIMALPIYSGTEQTNPEETTETRLSNKLLKALRRSDDFQVRRSLRYTKPEQWPKEFSLLGKSHPVQEIEQVLDWYCKHIGKEHIPVIISAKAFREKYQQVKQAIHRSGSVPEMDSVEITEETEEIIRHLDNLGWSPPDPTKLPAAIQVSLNNYKRFRVQLMNLVDGYRHIRDAEKPTHIRVAEEFLAETGPPSHYVLYWFVRLSESTASLSNWKGGFANFIFRYDHPAVTRTGQQISHRYCHSYYPWQRIIENLEA